MGARFDGAKLYKKVQKSLKQLKVHDPPIRVSTKPTKNLLVSNSSVLCGVSLEELERIFLPIDPGAEFIVFPSKRSYSFVQCSDAASASRIRDELNGFVHPLLSQSHQPFIISFVENLPEAKLREDFRPGDLGIIDDYISEDDEKMLVDFLGNRPTTQMKNRNVFHFGHEFDYSSNAAFKRCEPIPTVIDGLIDRLLRDGHITQRPDQVTVNIYEAGQGIPAHYDTHSAFEDPVVSLSLLSDVVMDFKDGANSARIAPVLLPRRSLCLIQGESRYRWKHGIVSRRNDVDPRTNRVLPRRRRISLTFRKIRTKPCECRWKEFCDWDRGGDMGVPKSSDEAAKLEDSYVADVYENIAAHFDETRHSTWKAVAKFVDDLPKGSLLFDVGCGNGKYLVANDGLLKVGCDMCSGLCSIASSKGCHVVRADALRLPFRDESADATICIAVLHHIATLERRKQLIRELLRVMKPGGKSCVTVWSMDQSGSEYAKMRGNKEEESAQVVESAGAELETNSDEANSDAIGSGLRDGTGTRLVVHDGKNFQQQDVLVPWVVDKNEETFLRYYHVFRRGEAEELVASVDGCCLEDVVLEQGNYVIFFSKAT